MYEWSISSYYLLSFLSCITLILIKILLWTRLVLLPQIRSWKKCWHVFLCVKNIQAIHQSWKFTEINVTTQNKRIYLTIWLCVVSVESSIPDTATVSRPRTSITASVTSVILLCTGPLPYNNNIFISLLICLQWNPANKTTFRTNNCSVVIILLWKTVQNCKLITDIALSSCSF